MNRSGKVVTGIGKWALGWVSIALPVGLSYVLAFVSIHLLDRDSAPLGTNLNYELTQSAFVGIFLGFLVAPLVLLRTERKWWWIGGTLVTIAAAFFLGPVVNLAIHGSPEVTRSLIIRQTFFTAASALGAALSPILNRAAASGLARALDTGLESNP